MRTNRCARRWRKGGMEKELLSIPCAASEEFEERFSRKDGCGSEEDGSRGRFHVADKRYNRQYSHVYFCRLLEMTPVVLKAARRKWGDKCPVRQLKELVRGERCCVVGTLFKSMALKPSILKDIGSSQRRITGLPPQPPRSKYIAPSDELILEDQLQRVTLCGDISTEELVTGLVVAVLGEELDNGKFHVEDHCFVGIPPQEPMETDQANDRYVLLVSGLNLGSAWCDQLSIQLLVDYLSGQLGAYNDQLFCSSIVRVIVAGNSITDKPLVSNTRKDKVRYLSRNYTAETVGAVKELDSTLAQLSSSVLVDLMPGSHDPTNHVLPQQPLHKCMFPQGSRWSNLKGVTNPYEASIHGVLFLGTSGQNTDDVYKNSSLLDRMQILENTLHWGHMAPTAPDTLASYPYANDDPFILKKCPHVYFSGNQPSLQHRTVHGDQNQRTLLVTVPNFDLTHSCALVNLRTLECQELSFATTCLSSRDNPELKLYLSQRRQEEEQSYHSPVDREGEGETSALFEQEDSDDDMD